MNPYEEGRNRMRAEIHRPRPAMTSRRSSILASAATGWALICGVAYHRLQAHGDGLAVLFLILALVGAFEAIALWAFLLYRLWRRRP